MMATKEAKPTKPNERKFVAIPEPSAMEFIYRPRSRMPPRKKEEKSVHKRLNYKLQQLKKKNKLVSIEHRHSEMKMRKKTKAARG